MKDEEQNEVPKYKKRSNKKPYTVTWRFIGKRGGLSWIDRLTLSDQVQHYSTLKAAKQALNDLQTKGGYWRDFLNNSGDWEAKISGPGL